MNTRRTITRTLRAAPRRSISTSVPVLARGSTARDDTRKSDPWDIKNVQPYQFDDTTTLGHMLLEKQREKLGSLMRIEQDRELLRDPLPPPNILPQYLEPVRPTLRQETLTCAHLPPPLDLARERTPVQAPRWTSVGSPVGTKADGTLSDEQKNGMGEEEREGWFEMSEEGWREGRMNRKWLSDVLDGMIKESNDPNSTIPSSTPLDMRYHLAREQKKRRTRESQGTHNVERKRGMEARGSGGGVKGFPEGWL